MKNNPTEIDMPDIHLSDIEMIDMIFDLQEGLLADDYPFELWQALTQRVPSLAESRHVGLLPMRLSDSGEQVALPKRAKFTLRLPAAMVESASALSGQRFELGDSHLQLGSWKTRPLQHSATLHAQLVASDSDEVQFMEQVETVLSEMGIKGQMICGRPRTLTGKSQYIQGYSLVLHDLSVEASLQLQCYGIGAARQYGCGIFVPYKLISGLE